MWQRFNFHSEQILCVFCWFWLMILAVVWDFTVKVCSRLLHTWADILSRSHLSTACWATQCWRMKLFGKLWVTFVPFFPTWKRWTYASESRGTRRARGARESGFAIFTIWATGTLEGTDDNVSQHHPRGHSLIFLKNEWNEKSIFCRITSLKMVKAQLLLAQWGKVAKQQ